MIDKVLYINLDHRTDRRESIESVLSGFKYERIPAIKHKFGTIGASMSHIKALEYAISNGWNNVLIMEDDMLWKNFKENYEKLRILMSKNYDVIVLGGVMISHDPQTYKLNRCNSAGAYIVNKNYYTKLLQNFQRGLMLLTSKYTSANVNSYHIDTYWHKLQATDNWYILPMCYSEEDFSDVAGRVVNWKPLFEQSH
jgi:glycosyl transferase family 25